MRASRELRCLKFDNFRRKYKKDTDAFKHLVSEIERLSCLGEDDDKSNCVMYSVLWTSVEGMEWGLHSLGKKWVENDLQKEVEAIATQ